MKNAGTKSVIQNSCQNWPSICANTAKTFRLTFDEQESLFRNKIARLIAMIPYIAKCDEAERTALAHIAIYITALRGDERPSIIDRRITRTSLKDCVWARRSRAATRKLSIEA